MLDLSRLELDEIAQALADRTDYEHRWLINPDTGKVVFWTSDTGIDGHTPVDLDELDEPASRSTSPGRRCGSWLTLMIVVSAAKCLSFGLLPSETLILTADSPKPDTTTTRQTGLPRQRRIVPRISGATH